MRSLRELRGAHLVPLAWALVWLAASAFMVVQVGFWNHVRGVELQDVNVFKAWSDFLVANNKMPIEESWQYPPATAFLMLIPRIGGSHFGQAFVGLMVVFYMAGWILLAALAERERRDVGVWVWLLAIPTLLFLPVLRFDLVPTVFAIAALVIIHRRPAWFGVLAGVGAMVKVWPVIVLFGEWDRRRLVRAVAAAAATAALIFLVAGILFGDQTGFVSNQGSRGLQVEAVGATPWQLRDVVTGEAPHEVARSGTNEIGSGPADAVATLAELASLAVLAGAAGWWIGRERAIRRGRKDLASPNVSRDFVFTITLLLVVTSRVLSPQFMVWLVGLAAVVLTGGTTRLSRPAWILLAAVPLTMAAVGSPPYLVMRNVALLAAAIDASVAMVIMLRAEPPPRLARSPHEAAAITD